MQLARVHCMWLVNDALQIHLAMTALTVRPQITGRAQNNHSVSSPACKPCAYSGRTGCVQTAQHFPHTEASQHPKCSGQFECADTDNLQAQKQVNTRSFAPRT